MKTLTRNVAWSISLALIAATTSSARADQIDKELFKKAGVIMKDLEGHKYKNVAVLKFQVRKGSAAPSMAVGKLNSVMATRLENALIYYDNDKNPIGITRGASVVAAAKDKQSTYLTPEGRQSLFRNKYPLAWGSSSVEVDAFLTGLVEISPDLKNTKVTIKAFDRKNPEPRKVMEFIVDTDVALLRDTNMNFMVAKRAFQETAKADEPEEALNKAALTGAQELNKQGKQKLSLEQAREYLDVSIVYDGQPVDITGEGFINKPSDGQKVLVKIKAKQKLGLLLRVNGINTINEQRQEASDLNEYNWWVLDPNVDYTIRGFYKDGAVRLFEAKTADIVPPTELGDNAERHGKIDFDIFVEDAVAQSSSEPKTRKFNFRTVNTRSATFADLKAKVSKASVAWRNKAIQRTFIVGGATQQQQLETTTYNGRHVGGFTVNYRANAGDPIDGGEKTGGEEKTGN